MKLPLLSILRGLVKGTGQSMRPFYKLYDMTRQGYHQGLKRSEDEQALMDILREEIYSYRCNKDRLAGSRSLFYNLSIKERYSIGITKFEQLLSRYDLSLQPLRIRVVTTQSCRQSWNYKNLINGLVLNGLNQLVVGDITYISLGKDRYYLFCLTDVFTMRIVGHSISNRMRKEEAIVCLDMFIKLRKRKNLQGCIHHTDGGGQYFSGKYLTKLGSELSVSVARSCLENGLAEQKNGFIKHHLIPTMNLNSSKSISSEMSRVIDFYNSERKQAVLGWRSPIEFEKHLMTTKKGIYLRLHDHEKNIPSKRHGF